MFDIGFWELVILFGLGLMVLGPERMPKVAAKLGRWAGQARQMARNLSKQLRDEIEPVETSIRSADQAMRKNMGTDIGEDFGKDTRKDFSDRRPDIGESANVTEPDPAAAKNENDASESAKPGDQA